MKTIYAGAFGAFSLVNNKYQHLYQVMSVVADATQAEVEDHGLELAQTMYPESSGYYGHYSRATEVTSSQIQDYLESRS